MPVAVVIPAGVLGQIYQPLHAGAASFMEVVSQGYNSAGCEIFAELVEELLQLWGGVQEASACQAVTDNEVELACEWDSQDIAGNKLALCRAGWKWPLLRGNMWQQTVICHPCFQWLEGNADGGGGVELRGGFHGAVANAATQIQKTSGGAEFLECVQLLGVASDVGSEAWWVGAVTEELQ